MLNNVDEKRISKKRPVKIRYIPGFQIIGMHHYIIPISGKNPLIPHVGANDTVPSNLKKNCQWFVKIKVVTISMPVKRTENAKISTTLKLVNEQLSELKIKLVKNYKIYAKQLSDHGLSMWM